MEHRIANTPEPPYYAVIFTTIRTGLEPELYTEMNDKLMEMVQDHEGFLGIESAGAGLTITYWKDLESIQAWKKNSYHVQAKAKGISTFYSELMTRFCLVERDNRIETGVKG